MTGTGIRSGWLQALVTPEDRVAGRQYRLHASTMSSSRSARPTASYRPVAVPDDVDEPWVVKASGRSELLSHIRSAQLVGDRSDAWRLQEGCSAEIRLEAVGIVRSHLPTRDTKFQPAENAAAPTCLETPRHGRLSERTRIRARPPYKRRARRREDRALESDGRTRT